MQDRTVRVRPGRDSGAKRGDAGVGQRLDRGRQAAPSLVGTERHGGVPRDARGERFRPERPDVFVVGARGQGRVHPSVGAQFERVESVFCACSSYRTVQARTRRVQQCTRITSRWPGFATRAPSPAGGHQRIGCYHFHHMAMFGLASWNRHTSRHPARARLAVARYGVPRVYIPRTRRRGRVDAPPSARAHGGSRAYDGRGYIRSGGRTRRGRARSPRRASPR